MTARTAMWFPVVVVASILMFALTQTVPAGMTLTWNGAGANNLASNPDNWGGGVAPVDGDGILLDATTNRSMTWDITNISVTSWTQVGYTGTVTFLTKYPAGGTFTNFLITGDCVVSNGVWTHLANSGGAVEYDRLVVTIKGSLTIGTGASINVSSRGYAVNQGPGKGTSRGGGGHGGQGGQDYLGVGRGGVYGSVTAPTNLGSGGEITAAGGGAVRLTVAGTAALDGVISARGQDGGNTSGGGAGGSVFIVAGALAGSGVVNADGGNGNNGAGGGGGGRIAVVLTNAGAFGSVTFTAIGGLLSAYGAEDHGAAGTIYLKGTNDIYGNLWVDASNRTTAALTLFTVGSNRFDRITLTNGAAFGASGGAAVLDLTNGPVVRTYGGVGHLPARLILGHGGSEICGLQGMWPDRVMEGYTLSVAGTNALIYNADLTLTNGAVLAHERNRAASDPTNMLILSVAGQLTVASNATIDVSKRGYGPGFGPGTPASSGSRAGGGHGGQGGQGYAGAGGGAYGSVMSPMSFGSGGSGSALPINTGWGGGVAILQVSGTATVNGAITADGQVGMSTLTGGGAGGSIMIIAGALAGAGAISANGGNGCPGGYAGGGGGGRIAVALTNANDFGNVTMMAFGGNDSGSVSQYGAGGTIYRKGTNDSYGNLVVSNGSATAAVTLFDSNVRDLVFNDVVILGQGRLGLASNMTVYGSWSNRAAFIANAGSRVTLAGSAPAILCGSNTFDELVCTNAGKSLNFEAGCKTSVTGLLNLAGSTGSELVLRSTVSNSAWFLVLAPGKPQTVVFVNVRDSNAAEGDRIVAPNSIDAGSNVWWSFGGTNVTWTGAADTNWGRTNNWDTGILPTYLDLVYIPVTGKDPILDTSRDVAALTIDTGATLKLNGFPFTVRSNLVNNGMIIASGSETVTLQGDIAMASNSFTAARSTIVLAGATTQTIQAADVVFYDMLLSGSTNRTLTCANAVFNRLTVSNSAGRVTFESGFRAGEVICEMAGDELVFKTNALCEINALWLHGTPTQPIVLRSSNPGNCWLLKASGCHGVRYVNVQDSDASSGAMVHAIDSINEGNNTNWDFGTWCVWNGSQSTDFFTTNNWVDGVAPGTGSMVWIDGYVVNPPILATTATLERLTVGLSQPSDLTLNGALTVSKDIVISRYGNLTHGANVSSETNKLNLAVGGDLYLHAGGGINVNARGYTANQGLGKGTSRGGGGHGGQGGQDYLGVGRGGVYGSVTAPTNLGSGGEITASGGGAVRLTVAGTATLDGAISARGQDGGNMSGGGAGGSVFITAGALAGSGVVSADGGNGYNGAGGGGGGRIAVVLTNAGVFGGVTFTAIGGLLGAYNGNEDHGAAGTIYLKGTNDLYGNLRVDASNRTTAALTLFTTGSNRFDLITLTNGATFGASGGAAVLDLTNGPVVRTYGGVGHLPARLILGHGGSEIQGLPGFWPEGIMAGYTLSVVGTNALIWNADLTLTNGAVLAHERNRAASDPTNMLILSVAGQLTVASNATIDVSKRGYGPGFGPGTPASSGSRAGGGHGGQGGQGYAGAGGGAYGSVTAPTSFGSGGSGSAMPINAGWGGGVAILQVSGTATVDGAVTADGQVGMSTLTGGGAGGSIMITAGALAGTGAISVNGGNGYPGGFAGGGGGGRIVVALTNANDFGNVAMTAFGGNDSGNVSQFGAGGTIYRERSSNLRGRGILTIDNTNKTTDAMTMLPSPSGAVPGELDRVTLTSTNTCRIGIGTNVMIGDLFLKTNSILHLQGCTLSVNTRYHDDWGNTNWVVYAGGQIVWMRLKGMVITLW